MYIVQNAFRNVLRNKSRNMLIGTIIFVIIVSTVVALMINNTTGNIIEDYKSRFGAEVILSANMERLRELAVTRADGRVQVRAPVIPADQYMAFGESEYLQESLYVASIGVNAADMTAVDAERGGGIDRAAIFAPGVPEPIPYFFSLKAGVIEDFKDGLRAIAQGRMPESMGEAIISSELAELNRLSIGDTLSLASHLTDADRHNYEIGYEVTIVGTYFDATEEYVEGGQRNAYTNRRNEVLTVYETVVQPMEDGLSGIRLSATYYLKDPGLLGAFAEEVYAKGLDPVYDVQTDEAGYNKIIGPVEGLRSISVTFMIIVLLFGGTIIALLSSIAIRERKYEIGVLRHGHEKT